MGNALCTKRRPRAEQEERRYQSITQLEVLCAIISHNTDHPSEAGWHRRRHLGWCAHSCPCCRAQNVEDFQGCCDSCEEFVQVLAVSKLWKAAAKKCRYQ